MHRGKVPLKKKTQTAENRQKVKTHFPGESSPVVQWYKSTNSSNIFTIICQCDGDFVSVSINWWLSGVLYNIVGVSNYVCSECSRQKLANELCMLVSQMLFMHANFGKRMKMKRETITKQKKHTHQLIVHAYENRSEYEN